MDSFARQNRGKTWIFCSTGLPTALEHPGRSSQEKTVNVGETDIDMMGMMAIGDQLELMFA